MDGSANFLLFKKVMNACGPQYGILFWGGRHRCRQDGFRDGRACSLKKTFKFFYLVSKVLHSKLSLY
jgi:hypothetical protein